jgi:hypothetical protein
MVLFLTSEVSVDLGIFFGARDTQINVSLRFDPTLKSLKTNMKSPGD